MKWHLFFTHLANTRPLRNTLAKTSPATREKKNLSHSRGTPIPRSTRAPYLNDSRAIPQRRGGASNQVIVKMHCREIELKSTAYISPVYIAREQNAGRTRGRSANGTRHFIYVYEFAGSAREGCARALLFASSNKALDIVRLYI